MALHDTGWVSCSDWTNQKLGGSVGNNLVHNLGKHLRELVVRVLVSTDGTDANSFELGTGQSAAYHGSGVGVSEIDEDEIIITTGSAGVHYINESGYIVILTSHSYQYRVILENIAGQVGATGATGPQGSNGEDGTTYLFLVPAWDSATAYAVDDVVFDGSTAYYCIQANTNNQPSTSSSYWTACNSSYVAGTEPSALDGAVWFKE